MSCICLSQFFSAADEFSGRTSEGYVIFKHPCSLMSCLPCDEAGEGILLFFLKNLSVFQDLPIDIFRFFIII